MSLGRGTGSRPLGGMAPGQLAAFPREKRGPGSAPPHERPDSREGQGQGRGQAALQSPRPPRPAPSLAARSSPRAAPRLPAVPPPPAGSPGPGRQQRPPSLRAVPPRLPLSPPGLPGQEGGKEGRREGRRREGTRSPAGGARPCRGWSVEAALSPPGQRRSPRLRPHAASEETFFFFFFLKCFHNYRSSWSVCAPPGEKRALTGRQGHGEHLKAAPKPQRCRGARRSVLRQDGSTGVPRPYPRIPFTHRSKDTYRK